MKLYSNHILSSHLGIVYFIASFGKLCVCFASSPSLTVATISDLSHKHNTSSGLTRMLLGIILAS